MNCGNKMNSKIFDINLHEKIYSQNGEDGIL